jgi:branched-chain amino acid transport system permease protein
VEFVDFTVGTFLVQDGIINGAIYALAALALVLVFAVTRVILVPQGEFVAFAAMTMAWLETGRAPPTAGLLVALGALSAAATLIHDRGSLSWQRIGTILVVDVLLPVLLLLLTAAIAPLKLGLYANALLTLLLVAPMGPMIYRIAFRPLADATILSLIIAAFGVHFALLGLGLVFFGPEGVGSKPLVGGSFSVGDLIVTGQSTVVLAVTVLCFIAFTVFFRGSLLGAALRACSSNRLGARLTGIPTVGASEIAFAIAAGLGAVSGILSGPLIVFYYDSGFLIGLKAFVAAILAGLVSFPLTALAAVAVGIAEAFFSFWASTFKEALVFGLLLPALLWLSLRHPESPSEAE